MNAFDRGKVVVISILALMVWAGGTTLAQSGHGAGEDLVCDACDIVLCIVPGEAPHRARGT